MFLSDTQMTIRSTGKTKNGKGRNVKPTRDQTFLRSPGCINLQIKAHFFIILFLLTFATGNLSIGKMAVISSNVT